MPRKKSYLTFTDQFCGCGGSSQGVRNYAAKSGNDIEIVLAMNHWPLAVETHNSNFPDATHVCTDISACNPRRYVSTDFLTTSPECTNQTGANGKVKPKKQLNLFEKHIDDSPEERSRATMWDVPRFAEYHGYNGIIVENVVEARNWVMFESWLHAMHSLGYNHRCCYLNSRHFNPCPQSRDRMYVVFWKKGNKAPNLEYTPKAYCEQCGTDVFSIQRFKPKQKSFKYDKGYYYACPKHHTRVEPYSFAALNIIDWSDPGRQIGDRLSENTMRRIRYGTERFWGAEYPLPLILKTDHTKQQKGYIHSVGSHLFTQATWQTFGILFPFIVENKGESKSRPIINPLSTLTTVSSHAIFSPDPFKSFLSYYNGGSDVSSSLLEPAGTFVTTDRAALLNYTSPSIEDCYYRTLNPNEVKMGMAFDKDYIVLGSGKDQVRQCGNAVTPPVMEWLTGQLVQSLS